MEALEEMLRTVPKHKGTDKLQADIKRRISQLRREGSSRKAGSRAQPYYHVEREGAAQAVLIGPPNSGKSSLVAALTHALPEVAAYPLTTRAPLPGMMPFENIQIQLVDTPPICPEFDEGWLYGAIRAADGAIFVLDCSDDGLLYLDAAIELLPKNRVFLVPEAARVEDDAHLPRGAKKRCMVIANKADLPNAFENLAALRDLIGGRLPGDVLPVSARTGMGLESLKRRIFSMLGIIRVYSKPPGRKPDMSAPFVLSDDATVLDAAEVIHKDFATNLKFARKWGQGLDGQMVSRDHRLSDGDVIEFRV
jgi:ribosome-interacting GTPase 1